MLWSPSCFTLSCGGAPISIVRQYIEQQRTPHRKRALASFGAAKPKDGYAVRAILPRPKGRGLSRT